MKQNIIFSIMMVLTVALSVVSCSNETEESSVEARVLELKHKIYATAEEYGVRNYTINEVNLRAHLDMTDAEIDDEFKTIVSMVGTYVGKMSVGNPVQLFKKGNKLTRGEVMYPELWTGSASGSCEYDKWKFSITLDYTYDDEGKSYVQCSHFACEKRKSYFYDSCDAYVSQENSYFRGSIAFDYDAYVVIEQTAINGKLHLYCSYDDNDMANYLTCHIVLES